MGAQGLISNIVHFYSGSFLVFLAPVFAGFWLVPRSWRPGFLLLASYVFYACWDYRFLPLILVSTSAAHGAALLIRARPSRAKIWLWAGVLINLAQLATFKYSAFFTEAARTASNWLGTGTPQFWEIALPIGISFYTFQAISYVVDVYWRKIEPAKSFVHFALFVAFFPHMIAGPIARGTQLLPQLDFDLEWRKIPFAEAAYLFAWGFCKKRLFADRLDPLVSYIYGDPSASGSSILVAFVAFTVQSYCDISGYADMARGIALLFGIRLPLNFYFPFFAPNPVEFWKRWHISLSLWVRHYVYVPLLTQIKRPYLVILITFLVMGLWHGPRWHYLHWGIYWASVSIAYQLWVASKAGATRAWHCLSFLGPLAMIAVIIVGQSFFRADGIAAYAELWKRVPGTLSLAGFRDHILWSAYLIVGSLLAYEALMLRAKDELMVVNRGIYWQITFYVAVFFLYRNLGGSAYVDFIYFHF
jgi:D-alanyl-lipoteichoic acid acyltransferase DltB (MBOAT superfamily)